jgi:hypothetical protein
MFHTYTVLVLYVSLFVCVFCQCFVIFLCSCGDSLIAFMALGSPLNKELNYSYCCYHSYDGTYFTVVLLYHLQVPSEKDKIVVYIETECICF